MASRNRSAEKESFWRLALEEFGESGLSVRAFCAREGLSEASFYGWRRALRKRDAEGRGGAVERGADLVAVEVIETDAAVDDGSAALLEIATPGGLTLRFPADVRPRHLAAVVAAIVGDAAC